MIIEETIQTGRTGELSKKFYEERLERLQGRVSEECSTGSSTPAFALSSVEGAMPPERGGTIKNGSPNR